ncbi:DUF1501 domain-containing protein [Rhodopirellula europaea]|jgi:hypothetical protein|uniref:Protein containing DUF1501 n=2 Tax=Rhodopirellula TaxID=265488 RepID=M5SSB0_9BACT|nr:DUF1501 domain-containing protein [Rhodopirellula europaea]EMI29169.1 protein containing DUF1501 [Rhodopirellula europaea SH398]
MNESALNPISINRRALLQNSAYGFGGMALGQLLASTLGESSAFANSANAQGEGTPVPGSIGTLHHAAKAKRVIFLFQSGAPSQLDLFDYKPLLNQKHGTELPDEIRGGQRLTGMSGNQSSLPLVGSPFEFKQHGESGTWMSDQLPYTSKIADDICVVRSMYTEAINHGPAVTFMQTGSMFPGRPSMGAWVDYGLGSENENLPAFVVMTTKNQNSGQPLVSRFWGNGFLPSEHQGVQFRSGADPVLYLSNPQGIDSKSRRSAMDALSKLHQMQLATQADPLVEARIAQYEMAFAMQSSIPEATDFADEPEEVFELYGKDSKNPGSFAANCLMARRLAQRGARFIQLYHKGWDHHGGLPKGLPNQCKATDQASAALVQDLKRLGMLEDTLVIWGGEFGRTNYCQGKLTENSFGRDHHPRCFSLWMAGGGVKPGIVHGATDDFGYNLTEDPVHIHDLHATIMHLLGVDHERLTFRYQGRQFRLTDVHGEVVHDILA